MAASTSAAGGIRAVAMAGAGIRAVPVVAGNITDDVGANVHTRAGREISPRRFEEFFLPDGNGEEGLVFTFSPRHIHCQGNCTFGTIPLSFAV